MTKQGFTIVLALAMIGLSFTGCKPRHIEETPKEAQAQTGRYALEPDAKIDALKAPAYNQVSGRETIKKINYFVTESWGNTGKGMKWVQETNFNVDDQGNWVAVVVLKAGGSGIIKKKQTLKGYFNFREFDDLKKQVFKSEFFGYQTIESQMTPAQRPYSVGASTLYIETDKRKHSVKWQGHHIVSIQEVTPSRDRMTEIKALFLWMDKRVPRFN